MPISTLDRKLLWAETGNMCSICKKPLIKKEAGTVVNIGEEAHIIAKRVNGPRGDHDLPIEERDTVDNIILLCNEHHKEIDTLIDKYTIDELQKIKREHVEWVKTVTKNEGHKQKLIILRTIKKIVFLCDFKNWEAHISSIEYHLSKNWFDALSEINIYLFKRFRSIQHATIEKEIDNFQQILGDFLSVYSRHIEYNEHTQTFRVDRFYKINEWNPSLYAKLGEEFDNHINLVENLSFELTRAGNRLIDKIRAKLIPELLDDFGYLAIYRTNVVTEDGNSIQDRLYIPRYTQEQQKYKNLEDFIKNIKTRDFHLK
jgi:hypothetical protein